MQNEIFKYFISPCPTSRPIIKFPTFSPISRLGGDPVRIINSESCFMKDSLKWNWWKLLRGIIISNFALSRFPRPKERWEGPSKAAEFLGSAEEWHHVSSGRREREASLLHSLSLGVQRIKPKPSIQPIIKFIFSPHVVGLTSWALRQSETPFCLSNFETKQKPGIFTRRIGKSG